MVHIEHYTAERIPDREGNASFWDFHAARNAVVRTCKRHGPTGPFGELPLDKVATADEWIPLWERGDPNAVLFVDDQSNANDISTSNALIDYFTEMDSRLDGSAKRSSRLGSALGFQSICPCFC